MICLKSTPLAVAVAACSLLLAGSMNPGPIRAATPEQSSTLQVRDALARDPQLHPGHRYDNLPSSARNTRRAMLGTGTYPVTTSFLSAFANALANPNAAPSGANVAGCRLTAAHPYPVVLVHGTLENMADNFGAIAPILANDGYCVYAFDYGGTPNSMFQGVDAVPNSAMQIAAFVRSVLSSTGARKVDLVGHSQGGMQLEYVAKLDGGARFIDKLVALDPSTHGTTLDGFALLGTLIPGANGLIGSGCQACVDQEIGSTALAPLDAPPIAVRGPKYTVIETLTDEVITPSSSAFINEPGVTNEYIQNFCPFDAAEHINTPYDLVTIQLVLDALHPATATPPNCFLAWPFPA